MLQGGGGRIDVSLEWRRVQLEQLLPRFHFGALLELAAQHDAAHLRADVGRAEGGHPARQFVAEDDGRRLQLEHRDGGGRRGVFFRRGFGTGGKAEQCRGDQYVFLGEVARTGMTLSLWLIPTGSPVDR